MLLAAVVAYLALSVFIGLYVARNVSTTADYAVAGRNLSLPVVTATVFATWFGSETVLGVSSEFLEGGLGGIVADPFGAAMCLILAGLFFAPKLYRLKLLTIGTYYRVRYNKAVEVFCSACIILSYLGWVAAQITALGLIFNVLSDGVITQSIGMVIGAVIVLSYTVFGGMVSVAYLDAIQMFVIVVGLFIIAWIVGDLAGGVGTVIEHADQAGKFQFFPEQASLSLWVPFVGAWLTMMLGSIPQQDVFQRITSAKNEKVAMQGSVLGGTLYFFIAFIPVFLAYGATMIDPAMFSKLLEQDSQLILPNLVLLHTPVIIQIIFFGALLSAIMSTSSATLLAPSISFAENIVKVIVPGMSDKASLLLMRVCTVIFTVCVLLFALNSELSIFDMVKQAYEITLSAAFVPLAFGLYWKKASTQGAVASIVVGVSTYFFGGETWFFGGLDTEVWPTQLVALVTGSVAMIVFSLLPQWLAHRPLLRDGVVHSEQAQT